ncbi:MAG: SulP family inorganic anion transporter [Gammaproteobacteria bacterium]|nr:SulP family inorganic anion transporter [Gammaproteobacteria bacterium]
MRWLPLLDRRTLRGDFSAALTGALVVLPQGVAFATIAGMPPQYGLYAGMVPAIVAALFGSSMHLVSGPTTAASVVLFSSLSNLAAPGSMDYISLALTLTFMVGVLELILGLARMGALVNYISHSVIVGFTTGAAILIAAKQIKYFFGIEITRDEHLHDILLGVAQNITDTNFFVTIVAVLTLLSGLAAKRWLPAVPPMIAAMGTGILAYTLLTTFFGESTTHIVTVGAIPRSMPPLSAPDLSMDTIKSLSSVALAMTLFALTEAVSIGRALATRSGQRISGNQEFIGQGLSNMVGSFFSAYVATGSFNRSALNFQAGAKTPMAAIFSGLLLIPVVFLVAPLLAFLPKSAMAAMLVLVAWGLIDFKEIRHIFASSKREATILSVTFLAAIFLDLELAIFSGVILSLVLYLERVSHPRIVSRAPDPRLPSRKFSSDPDLPECPQVKFLRIDGSIFFGSVNHVQNAFAKIEHDNPNQKHLAIVADGINFVDIVGGEALAQEAIRRNIRGGRLYLIHVKEGLWVPLERCGCLDTIGAYNVFQSKTAAVTGIYQKLDKRVCATCQNHIFRECSATVPNIRTPISFQGN